jgi:uncharacterized protein
MMIVGLLLAVLVGMSLGLTGSGGSILTVPILVYVMGVEPVTAAAYSLFVVGITALAGSTEHMRRKQVDYRTAFFFGTASLITTFVVRKWLVPAIPETLFDGGTLRINKAHGQMLLFAVVMILAASRMIKPSASGTAATPAQHHYLPLLGKGVMVGLVSGMVGAGGGFLIIPALVLFAQMPMKKAAGTSLLIIAANSIIGFTGDLQNGLAIDWVLLGSFTGLAMAGLAAGIALSGKISGETLKRGFGWFLLLTGCGILATEILTLKKSSLHNKSAATIAHATNVTNNTNPNKELYKKYAI